MGLNDSQKLELDLLIPNQLWDVAADFEDPELFAACMRAALYAGYRHGTEHAKAKTPHALTNAIDGAGEYT